MTPKPIIARTESWIFNHALPYWAEHGIDRRNGGYVEVLSPDGFDMGVDYKRVRVACRQIYVFSHAALRGWSGALPLAQHGLDYLTGRAWMGEDRGFARTTARNGEVLDPTADTYEHAFALFAFSWAYRATRDAAMLEWMHRTLDAIERLLRHPSEPGFWNDADREGPRRQNPHMHMLEAAQAAVEAAAGTQDCVRFTALGEHIATLFRDRLFDRVRGVLPEYFTDDWRPIPDAQGALTEPGHHFEWTWILARCKPLIGVDLNDEARALFGFAEQYGIHPTSGAAYNRIRNDGTPVDRNARLWPNTERIKAAAGLFEIDGTDPMPIIQHTTEMLFDRYLTKTPAGSWIDSLDADARAQSHIAPASTFYHLFLAFSEMHRVAAKIKTK